MPKRPSGLKPGQHATLSGQYQIIGPRGGKGPEVTSVRNEPVTTCAKGIDVYTC
jgi:hypothetical protein